MTRILQRLCNVHDVSYMTSERCNGFQVLPRPSFFPIDVRSTKQYFNKRSVDEELQWDESVVAAHVYNQLTAHRTVYKNSNQLYVQLARSSCPRVLEAAPDQF